MKKLALFILLISLTASRLDAQGVDEKDAIKKTITTFFDGMRKADTTLIRGTISKGMVLHSVGTSKEGETKLITEDVNDFLKSIAKPHTQVYDERVVFDDIKRDGPLASVWAPYKFYLGNQFSHCGVDVFQLAKIDGAWKIIYIVDTRRKDNCPE